MSVSNLKTLKDNKKSKVDAKPKSSSKSQEKNEKNENNDLYIPSKSPYKNINNYRHIIEGSSGGGENVNWLMGLRDMSPNVKAMSKVTDDKLPLKTIPILPNFSYHPRADKNNYVSQNPYKDIKANTNVAAISNEMKVFKGCFPSFTNVKFETNLRNPIPRANDPDGISKFKHSSYFLASKSPGNPEINGYNNRDPNNYFSTTEGFTSNLPHYGTLPTNLINLNDCKSYNSSFMDTAFYKRNRITKFSTINDMPVFSPPKLPNSIENINKLNDLVSKPTRYKINKITYNKDKIFQREILKTEETSSLIGRHNFQPKYINKYCERNVNTIRHILSDGNLQHSLLVSSLRLKSKDSMQDNRSLVTGLSDMFEKDYISKHKLISNLNIDEKISHMKELRSHLKLISKEKTNGEAYKKYIEKLENNRIANELIFRGTKKKEEILKASS